MMIQRPMEPALAQRGVRCMLAGAERQPGQPAGPADEARLQRFLAYAGENKLDLTRQVVALNDAGCVIGMCLWVPSPGRTAALFAPGLQEHPELAAASQACCTAVLSETAAAGLVLVQVMLEPADRLGEQTFTAAGLTRIATLLYLERAARRQPPEKDPLPADLELLSYTPGRHEAFKQSISASYEQTLDCPALSSMRDVDDVMLGHQAIGVFRPDLWTLVMIAGVPAGCLLLAHTPVRDALDVVYLGLAPAARGRGLGRLLMRKALRTATECRAATLCLAVDESNTPALKLYRRFGLAPTARRVALVAQVSL